MSVQFTEELVEVREFEISSNESNEKKKVYQKIRQESKGKSFLSRILYGTFQTEHQYVDLKMAGKRPIKSIAKNNYDQEQLFTLYKENYGAKTLKYRIYENDNGMLCLEILTKGLGPIFYPTTYYRMGCDLEDMYVAEYRAKMELIRTVKKICERNDIY